MKDSRNDKNIEKLALVSENIEIELTTKLLTLPGISS
jgi:hypothetical protein